MFAPRVATTQTRGDASSTGRFGQPTSRQARNERDGEREREIVRENLTDPAAPRRLAWDFGKIPLFAPDQTSRFQASYPLPGILQAKLAVGQINDPLEHEADRVADQVMRMPAPEAGPTLTSAPPQISRKCEACEEEEEKVQRRETGTAEPGLSQAPASVHEVLRSPGQPLNEATRSYFEPRFGCDFSRVRVRDGRAAAISARAVAARAYTVGSDIVFGAEEYRPSTREGRALLAHELAHVRQNEPGGAYAAWLRRAPQSSTPLARVQQGETDLKQVARRLNVDPDELLLANPQIKDPTTLSPGQPIYLPLAQEPAMPGQNPASKLSLSGSARALKGDPTTATTPKGDVLPADERAFQSAFGDEALHLLQQRKEATREVTASHEIYQRTGLFPQTKMPFSGIEIKRGKVMSRDERYDAMIEAMSGQLQGPGFAQIDDVINDNRDPEYLTKQEFYDEFWAREKKEWNACEDEYIRPGKIDKCQRAVNEKYGGESFKAWRDRRELELHARIENVRQKIDVVASSGPISLTGRAVGRALGGEKWEEFGAALGNLGDAALVVYAGSKGATVEGYQGSTGLEVGRGTTAEVAPPPPAVDPAETQPGPPLTGALKGTEPTPSPGESKPAAPPRGTVTEAVAEQDVRGAVVGPDRSIMIRGVPASQPSKDAVRAAEAAVTDLIESKYGRLGVRDLSDPAKDPYAAGVDRLFIIGSGEGAVLLEVDAKLSIQDAPVTIREVSSFETAAATGGRSRRDLVDRALRERLISADEHRGFLSDIEHGLVLEEVHGFGAVSGISSNLASPAQGVSYEQGEQFAHIRQQAEQRASQNLSAEIRLTIVAPAADSRTGRQISNEVFRAFQEAFGLVSKGKRLR
jgi:Domain of unknown function (DUF4157)/LysM domain